MIILPKSIQKLQKNKNTTLKRIIMFYTAEWSTKLHEATSNVSLQCNLPLTTAFLMSEK